MRVLQIIPSLEIGGAERFVSSLACHLARSGHEVGVLSLYPAPGNWLEAQLRAAGAQLFFLDKHPGPDLRMIPRVAQVLRRFRPQVVHTHLHVLRYVLPARLLARRCGVVHTMHTAPEDEVERLLRPFQYVAFRTCVVPVAIGAAVAEGLRRVYGLRPRNVIPNGIPVADYAAAAASRDRTRGALGLPAEAPAVVTVGRLSPVKNQAALLRAFASPRLGALGAHLVVAGDGPLRPALEAQAAALGLAGRVHFLGARSDVPAILAAGDVFALTSRVEGNPLAVMEAMAAGKPVVATDVGCIKELVVEGTGRVVPEGDEAALEAALWALAADPRLARALGVSAARFAGEAFECARAGAAYERLYAEVA